MKPRPGVRRQAELAELAGHTEPFADATLYDWEYRRRRADVNFYRLLASERLGHGAGAKPAPILDLACGTGRLLLPLVRDGHSVVGIDRSAAMLDRARSRVARLASPHRSRVLLARADLRAFGFSRPSAFAVCAFHGVQHLVDDEDVVAFFRCVRRALHADGWFAFDVLPSHPAWIKRDPSRRWARTVFRHPTTGQRTVYSTSHVFDPRRNVVLMRLYYQPVDKSGRPSEPERVVRLTHRQFTPPEMAVLLDRAGLKIISRFAAFDENAHESRLPIDAHSDEHVYLAQPRGPVERTRGQRGQKRALDGKRGKFAAKMS